MTYEFTDRFADTTSFKMGLCAYRNRGEPRNIALWDGNRQGLNARIHMDLSEALRMATAILDLVEQSKSEVNPDF